MTRIGCKFLHNVEKNCEFGIKCSRRLCPCRHKETGSTQTDTDENIDNEENDESDEEFITNKSVFTSTPEKMNWMWWMHGQYAVYRLLCQEAWGDRRTSKWRSKQEEACSIWNLIDFLIFCSRHERSSFFFEGLSPSFNWTHYTTVF